MKNIRIIEYLYRGASSFMAWLMIIGTSMESSFLEVRANGKDTYSVATYEKAVKIAETTPPVAYTNLTAAVPWDKNTTWNDDATMVLVVSWIPAAYVDLYRKRVGDEFTTSADYDMWVTLVPEIQKFCKQYGEDWGGVPCDAAKARLNQFMGLPPASPKKKDYNEYFVEMWVRPEDLFRPCFNPDVSANSCNLDPDLSQFKTWTVDRMFQLANTPEWHRKWFLDNKKRAYPEFPWTRLGYTYDWSPLARTHQGASELVIKRSAKVTIKDVYKFSDYCPCLAVSAA